MSSKATNIIFGVLDLLLALLYILLFLVVIPGRSGYGVMMALVLGGPAAAAGVAMFCLPRSWARRLALVSSIGLLLICFVLILLLVSSAAYLHGIYGGVGQAGSAVALIAALLAIEVVGLVPGLQLVHLRRQGRPRPETR